MKISPEQFILNSFLTPVLDVRSPGEYEKGHISGAHSFPLFDNMERAEIGTIYKQIGKQAAIDRGLKMVSPKISLMVEKAREIAVENKILVHCWRGGMRSESVASLLKMTGIEVDILEGGYKAFRNWVLAEFEKEYEFKVLGGMTGSGKTDVLQRLKAMGQTVIDLEGLADHRGSAFGRLGATRKVTQAQFENDLAIQLSHLEMQNIWLEDESRKIGYLTIPAGIWEQMRTASFYYMNLDREVRVNRLMVDYGNFPHEELKTSIYKIERRLGGKRTQDALELLDAGKGMELTDLLLDYYDKSYQNSTSETKFKRRVDFEFSVFEIDDICKQLIAAFN